MTAVGPGPHGARARAREDLTRSILSTARAQLATVGPAQLSVRAVAREVGLVSSAVYRYFPSRDKLLTELLIICYDEVGERAETADAAVTDRSDYLARWLAIAHGVRDWAVAHPFDFALLYGSPVPDYVAPEATVAPAARVARLVVGLVREQFETGIVPPPAPADPPELHRALAGVREFAGADLPDELVVVGLRAWAGLVGSLTLELFGHLVNAVEDYAVYFDAVARRLAPMPAPAPSG